MDREEFKRRTDLFLEEADIAAYEELYEPAYMNAGNIDKDEFCKMLRDDTVRKFVQGISKAFTAAKTHEKSLTKGYINHRNGMLALSKARIELRKAISLIAATCDRALTASEVLPDQVVE